MGIRASGIVVAAALLAGCASGGSGGGLQAENQRLAAALAAAEADINQLQAERSALQATVADQSAVIAVLNTEKSSQVQASGRLRGQARGFVQRQMRAFKDFLQQGDLLDYLGGELVQRATLEGEAETIVDLATPVPRAGTLTGVAAWFQAPGDIQVQVLRPVDERLVVLWQSPVLAVPGAGVQRLAFPVGVGVEPGDLVAYHFPGQVLVPYDEGTGQAVVARRPLALGDRLRPTDLAGRDQQRAYAMGVYGLLN